MWGGPEAHTHQALCLAAKLWYYSSVQLGLITAQELDRTRTAHAAEAAQETAAGTAQERVQSGSCGSGGQLSSVAAP